jgi:predicted Zn-dependent peptidase
VVQKTRLPNGIQIVTQKMPYVRSVSMGVWVNVGARDESEAQGGLSHFIEHMIFKGTACRSAYQIAKEFDAIGGHTNAFTSMEHTCYHAKVMDTHLETMVAILSDIFLNSVFDPLEIERERPVIFQEIGMVEDTPEEYIHQLSGGHFWGSHPLGRSILGTRENIMTFDAATIRDYFAKFYNPERILISLAGNVEHQHLVDLVAPAFGSVTGSSELPLRVKPKINAGVQSHVRNLEQMHICLATLGLSLTDPGRFAASLLNTILGGNMSSRLFQEIREQRGLAYAVYSFMSSHVDTGMFGIYTGVNPDNARQATELVLAALDRICREPVSDEELRDAKEFTKGNLYLSAESVDNQMVRLAQNEIHFGRSIPLRTITQKIDAVQAEEIQQLARDLFHPDQISLTLLGPGGDARICDDLIR